jgi:hypothetical protein
VLAAHVDGDAVYGAAGEAPGHLPGSAESRWTPRETLSSSPSGWRRVRSRPLPRRSKDLPRVRDYRLTHGRLLVLF